MPQPESIAVIIPVYNGAAYLSEALESVLAQTLPADEIIVIDDGSKDASVQIARSFPQVRVIEQANAGVSASRNRGAAETSATWIAFLDQDDLWAPEKLERQIAAIRQHPDTDVCLTGKRDLMQVGHTEVFELQRVVLPPPSRLVGRLLYKRLRFVPSCTLVRRSAYLAAGGFEPVATPCEDWDLWLRMQQAGAVFTSCPEPLLLYRCHTSNVSSNGMKMYHGELRAFDLRIAPRLNPLTRAFWRQQAKSRFMAGVAIIDREHHRPFLKSMLTSLAWFPFGDWDRYKVAAHMLLTHFGLLRARAA